MAIVSMQKVAVVALRSQQEELIQLLHQEGVLEISDMREPSDTDHTEVHFRAAELDSAIEQLTELAPKETLQAIAKPTSEEEIIKAAMHTDVRGIIDRLHQLEHDDTELKRDLHDIHVRAGRAVPRGDAGQGLGAPDEMAYFTKGKSQQMPARRPSAAGMVGGGGGEPSAAVKQEAAMKEAEVQKKLDTNHQERVRLAQELPNLLRARQYLRWLNEKQAAREAVHETKRTVTIFGWVPKTQIQSLEKKLRSISRSITVLKVKPGEEESSPVLLRNSTMITPFESVTTLYGLPMPGEYDPTIYLAGFFILFFGLCLTDAGYGLVLAILMGIYLWKKKLTIRQAPLWWLLFFGGIATFFISIPFGGWFGLSPDQAPAFMTKTVTYADGETATLFKGQIWNLSDTRGITFFQNLAIALGLAHLSFGMFLAGIAKWRAGRPGEAFWSDFTSLLLIGTAIAYFLGPVEWKQPALYGVYASLVLMIWGKGYGSKWYVRPFKGLLGLINFALGMLSNTLSYLRLLALGLVTGALALAVNLVAMQISDLLSGISPILGIVVMVLILVAGHTVNIALNVLGAFIHSGRLQFVEFFSQFFEGGGRPFTPFSRSRLVS